MKKVAIFVCGEVAQTCTANGCLRAFNEREDAFERHPIDTGVFSFGTCNGCDDEPIKSFENKIEKFKKAGIDTVHLSTCIRGRCDHYETFAEILSEHFDVIGYTHGSPGGKKDNTVNLDKKL